MAKSNPVRGTRAARAAIEDGVGYLRGGSLDRAWQRFVAASELSADPTILSEVLRRQADVKRRRGDWAEALELVARAVHIARHHAISECEAAALNVEGTVHLQRGDFARAITVYEQALKLEPGSHQRGLISQNLGSAYAGQGEHEEAARWYAISSEAFSEAGLLREQILSMSNQGSVRLDQGDLIAAEDTFRAALRRLGALPRGDAELQALVEVNLAETLARRGVRLGEAHELMARATGHFSVSSNRPYRVACHRVLAMVAYAQGDPGLAASALEGGLKLAREIESASEVEYFERELLRLREGGTRSNEGAMKQNHSSRFGVRLLAVLTLFVAFAGCEQPSDIIEPSRPTNISIGGGFHLASLLTSAPQAIITQEVGPAGGVLSMPDGHTLTFPAGALQATTTISAVADDGSLAVDFGPAGLVFPDSALPVLSLNYQNSDAAQNNGAVIVYLDHAGLLQEVLATSRDEAAGTAQAQIKHFSTYALATD